MIHAIMLDNFQHLVSPDEYCVSFSGTRAECEAEHDLPDGTETWSKRDYSSCVFVEAHALGAEPGKIFMLTPAAERALAFPEPSTRLIAAGAGFVAGVAGGILLHKHFASSISRRVRR